MSLEGVKEENEGSSLIITTYKKEPYSEDQVMEYDLYAGHRVKTELVLGPELIHPPDKVYMVQPIQDPSKIKTEHETDLESNIKKQPKLRDCYITLERLSKDKIKLVNHNHISMINRLEHAYDDNDKVRKITSKNYAVKKIYSSNSCDEEYSVKRTYIQHLENQTRPYKCEICKLPFVDENKLKRHSLIHVVEKQSKSCNNCNKHFETRRALINHIREHLGETTCQICNNQFASTHSLDRHKLIHTSERNYICDLCGKAFRHKSTLVFHIQNHTGIIRVKPHSCKACSKKFTHKAFLLAHERTHTGEKPFLCDICGRYFGAKNNLKKHILTHDAAFMKKRRLLTHDAAFTKERRFSCDLCERRFIRKCDCIQHKRTHTNETPFTCEICEKRFKYKESLVCHLKLHSSQGIEKPHNCEVCGYKFRSKSHLTRHKLIHTGQKPFSCEICGKCFRHKSTLTSHMLIHTGEKPYACDMCAQRFTTSGNYSKHKRTAHE